MTNDQIRETLNKTLEKYYRNLRARIETDAWVSLIEDAYRANPLATAVTVLEFLQSHCYMPRDVLKAIYDVIELKNHPGEPAAILGSGAVSRHFEELRKEPALTFSKLPGYFTEDDVAEVVDCAREFKKYLDRGQTYLAGSAIRVLLSMCPDNQEINELYVQYVENRSTCGVPALRFRHQAKKKPLYDKEKIRQMLEEGNVAEAAGIFEKAIADDYKNYDAYYCLGNLYLLQGEDASADYIADLLLDTGDEIMMALLLKGRVLESRGQNEDALFYYDAAFRRSGTDVEAYQLRENLLTVLEGGEPSADQDPFRFLGRLSEQKDEFENVRISSDILNTVESADALISGGRLSEAYYELVKKGEENPGSSLLTFKQGYALYLMEREYDARKVLETIREEDALYERARYVIADIDRNITDNNKFDDIPPVELAGILFASGDYVNALEILNNMDISSMDETAWSIKGRCEIEKGSLNNALDSFNNAVECNYQAENVREMIAMIYQAAGEYDKALDMYDQAIKMSDKPELLCNLKAGLLHSLHRDEEMLTFRNSSYALLGGACDADGYAGMILLDDPNRREEALVYIHNAIAAGSAEVDFYDAYIDEFLEHELYYRAMLCADAGIIHTNVRDELTQKKAGILLRQGRNDLAALITEGLLLEKPGDSDLHYLYGRIQYALGHEREAIEWLESAVGLDHSSHEYIFTLAQCYYKIQDYDQALFYYTKAILLDENDCESFKKRANIYLRKEEDQKALADINRAMLLEPGDPETYMLIGNILAGYEVEEYTQIEGADSIDDAKEPLDPEESGEIPAEQDAEAETEEAPEEDEGSEILDDLEKDSEYYYTKAISIDPTFIDGYICRAKYYTEHGKSELALADIDTALQIEPDTARLHMLRGIICHLSGDNESAVKSFEKVAEEDGDNLTAFSYLAKCYNAVGRYDDALKAANDGLKKNDEFTNLYVNRGVALYNLGRYDDAIEDFNRVLIHRNNVNTAAIEATHRYKGLAFEKLGRIEEAITDYKMLLRYDPQSAGVKEHIAKLEADLEYENANPLTRLLKKRKDK